MKKLIFVAALSIAPLFSALADKDEKRSIPLSSSAPSTAPSSAPAAALAGMDLAIGQLQADALWSQLPVDWAGLRDYYAKGGQAIWFGAAGPTPLGREWPGQIERAVAAGMPMATMPPQISGAAFYPTPQEVALKEAAYSAFLTAAAIDAHGPLATDKGQGAKVLARIAAAKDPARELRLQLPDYHPFWRLHALLPAYVGYYQNGGWGKVPGKEKIVLGDRGPRVKAVKERLLATGELAALGADPELYDAELEAAAKAFQYAHGLNDDGVIGVRTIEEMNVPAEERLRSILYNLNKLRAEGLAVQKRHMIVNIPGTELRVINDGLSEYVTRAIVGRVERKTPILESEITLVKFNPEWSVPAKIARIDMLRHELDEPGYFAARNVRVYDSSGSEINPNSIDWHEVKRSGYFPYRLRQDPGPENALGPMKLDFKNDHAVFIHGTSAPALFAKQDRFFSSGCVRVEDPLGLSGFLLSDQPQWDREHIDAVVKTGKTEYVKLSAPLPLHIVYRTAWADEEGIMHFRRDVYGYDKKVAIPEGLIGGSLIADAAPAGKTQGNGE